MEGNNLWSAKGVAWVDIIIVLLLLLRKVWLVDQRLVELEGELSRGDLFD